MTIIGILIVAGWIVAWTTLGYGIGVLIRRLFDKPMMIYTITTDLNPEIQSRIISLINEEDES